MMQHNHSMDIPYLRVQLGLTQQQLADSLGISRSLVAMAETNRRSLPRKAMPLVLGMHRLAAKMPLRREINVKRGRAGTRVYNRVHRSSRLTSLRKAPIVLPNTVTEQRQHGPIKYATVQLGTRPFNVHLLNCLEDCEALLDNMLMQKERTAFQLQYLQMEAGLAEEKGRELTGRLTLLCALLRVGQQNVLKYPESPNRKKWEIKNAKLYYQKLLLEQQMEAFNAAAALQRERNINITEGRLQLLDRFIGTVRQRMEELHSFADF
jgi:transcriptional regulator with XRE-family HTH domain